MIITAAVFLLSALLVAVLACPWRRERPVFPPSIYDGDNRCRKCREHVADPHANRCRNDTFGAQLFG